MFYMNDMPYKEIKVKTTTQATTAADAKPALALLENNVIITDKADLPFQIIKGVPQLDGKPIVLEVFDCFDLCAVCA